MSDPRKQRPNVIETALAADEGMRIAESFRQKNGRVLPKDDVEFAGMLAIAYMIGRESIGGVVPP